jgi:hypothetical protein
MKRVTATMVTYDASEGRIEPGQTYLVEDEKADRWIQAGIATVAGQPSPPPPAEPDDDDGDEVETSTGLEDPQPQVDHWWNPDEEEPSLEELTTRAHKLHDEGLSERGIAQEMGLARTRVHQLLTS